MKLVQVKTRKLADANEVNKIYRDDDDTITVKKTYHIDVADNIYKADKTVIAMFNGREVTAMNRLELCKVIATKIISRSKHIKENQVTLSMLNIVNGVPKIDDAPRHSVAWLNAHGVRALNGNKVQNR